MGIDELVVFSSSVEGQGIEDHQNCTYTSAELRALASRLVELRSGSRVVEIGVYGGRSTSLYFQLQKELNLDIHLVDNWSWDVERAMRTFTSLVYNHFSEVPFTLHKMRSDYLGPKWELGIDFLHIDGWHDMDGIEPDCRLWTPWVVSGGHVAFHDSDCSPVAECIDKYVKDKGWTLVETAFRTTVWRRPWDF